MRALGSWNEAKGELGLDLGLQPRRMISKGKHAMQLCLAGALGGSTILGLTGDSLSAEQLWSQALESD